MSSLRHYRVPPPPPPTGPYLDYGPALPDSHGLTQVRLLVRDPEGIFAYWEGGDSIRVRDLTEGTAREFRVPILGTWYSDARPEHDYEVDLLKGGQVVAVSNRIRTPRRDRAASVDAEWTPTPGQEEVLRSLGWKLERQRAGYPGGMHS
jgi:hypothetical protein